MTLEGCKVELGSGKVIVAQIAGAHSESHQHWTGALAADSIAVVAWVGNIAAAFVVLAGVRSTAERDSSRLEEAAQHRRW